MKMRKRTIIIVLTLLLSVASVGLVTAVMIPSADELLTQSLETLETVTDGHAVVEVTADLPEESISGTFEVWGKLNMGPNGEPALRVEVLAASEAELVGVTAVTDGAQFWLYDPNRNTVIVGQAEEIAPLLAEKIAEHEGEWEHEDIPETPAEAVAKLLEYVTAERNGFEQVAGSNAYVLRLVPIPEKMPDEVRAAGGFVNVWLRASDQLPLAAEYTEGTVGSGKIEATLAEINTDLDESVFTFVIPDGTEIIEATDLLAELETVAHQAEPVDFEILTPADLPEAALVAETQQLGGMVVQRYDLPDGGSFVVAQGTTMSLDPPAEATSTETIVVRGVEGTLFTNDDNTRTLLAWREGDLFFVIGGDLTSEQALEIAESLQ